MPRKRVKVDSVAEGLLELLEARGVEYFFGAGREQISPPSSKPSPSGRPREEPRAFNLLLRSTKSRPFPWRMAMP
ncbi:MAG: hypothetical protein CM1200mP36_00370 [Gammaproteobacteria bacterium]|nr:MAG: hypothetical protein CM1200mP36_00370 [Gammaproteobacteria bacterium]